MHHTAFLHLKEAIMQAPILCYPDADEKYIVYIDASNDACRAQLSQEHDGMEFLIAFLLHMFTETQRKWSTTEQEAYGVYYAITNGTTSYKAPTSLSRMIISHSHGS